MEKSIFKTALITAASKGIGFAISKALLADGYHIILSSSNQDNLDKAFAELSGSAPDRVEKVLCNLRDQQQVKELSAFCQNYTAGIDILVNNCGGPSAGFFDEIDEDEWDIAHQEILKSAITLIHGCLPRMKEKKWGRVINITSIATRQYVDNLILSSAYRTALTSVSKVLSIQLAPYNITVNNIAPGFTMTDRMKELTEFRAKKQGISYEAAVAELDKMTPMNRLAQPEEIGALAAFLISDKAGYITGNTITIDGGLNRNMF
jgi:3-oxoacyl-[acyl-carrier protein] reductase